MSKGDDTRQRIIEKAAPVFNRLGFGNTAMSTLMEATGLEKGGIYRHFESKEELACAAFDHASHVVQVNRFQSLAETAEGLARLHEFIRVFSQTRSGIPGGCPIFNTAVENDDGNPALKKRAQAAYLRWISQLASYLEEAKRLGEIQEDVDVQATATFVLCSLEGALIAQNLTGNREILPRQAQQILLFLKHLQNH